MDRLITEIKNFVLPGSCGLCYEPLNYNQSSLCSRCIAELPYLGTHCQRCAKPLHYSTICPECQKKPPNFRRCIAAFNYQQPINKAIVRIKNDAHSPELKQLSLLLADRVLKNYEVDRIPKILIPMPLHWLTLFRRGFNQSHLIANILAAKLPNCAVRNDICSRKNYGTAQHLRTRQQRWRFMTNAFTAQYKPSVKDLRVALIDDVVTTGASATAATHSLLKVGIKSVDLWCIARTGWHNKPSSIKI